MFNLFLFQGPIFALKFNPKGNYLVTGGMTPVSSQKLSFYSVLISFEPCFPCNLPLLFV